MAAEGSTTRASPWAIRLFVILLLAINPTVRDAWNTTLVYLGAVIDDVGILSTVLCFLVGKLLSDTWDLTQTRIPQCYRNWNERQAVRRLGILPGKPEDGDIPFAMSSKIGSLLRCNQQFSQQHSLNVCEQCLLRKALCGPWLSSCVYLEHRVTATWVPRHLLFDFDKPLCENVGVQVARSVITDSLREPDPPADALAPHVYLSTSPSDRSGSMPSTTDFEGDPVDEKASPSPDSILPSSSSLPTPDNVHQVHDDPEKPEKEDETLSNKWSAAMRKYELSINKRSGATFRRLFEPQPNARPTSAAELLSLTGAPLGSKRVCFQVPYEVGVYELLTSKGRWTCVSLLEGILECLWRGKAQAFVGSRCLCNLRTSAKIRPSIPWCRGSFK